MIADAADRGEMALRPSDEDIQAMIDRAAVRDVIEGYFGALDRSDYTFLANCFTDDAELEYDVKPYRFTGGKEFTEFQRKFDHLSIHTHTVSSCVVQVNGDEAHSDTFGFAVLALGEGGPNSIRVRGLRYVDTLVRTPDGWRISKRKHTPTWQFHATAEAPALPLQP